MKARSGNNPYRTMDVGGKLLVPRDPSRVHNYSDEHDREGHPYSSNFA